MTSWLYDKDPLQYNMTVTVTDEHGLSDGPRWLTINVANARYPPEIKNLPALLTFTEPYGDNKLLFTVSSPFICVIILMYIGSLTYHLIT